MYQHPIYALLLSIMVIFIFIENCIQKGKLLKGRLSFSFLNTFCVVVLWILNGYINSEVFTIVYNSFMVFEYVFFGLLLFFVSYNYLQKMRNYDNFISSFKNTTFNVYFLTDKKDRIKEISESLLKELGCTKEEVIGKKFFDIANKKIRFNKLDDTEINNKMLSDYYKSFKHTVKQGEEFKRELYFHNVNGQNVILNLLEKPIFFFGKYAGRMNVGQRKDDMSLLSVEKELVHRNIELEAIQQKFIASLELTDNGVFFYEINDSYIWCNDILVKTLNINSNTITASDFHMNIHEDDFAVYQHTLGSLTPESPVYKISYRYKIGYNYQYVTERGKRIFDDNNQTILGYIDKHATSYFAKTNYKQLDEVKGVDELVTDLNILINNNTNFDLVAFRTTNLVDINNQHSRKIGDMILAEYVREVKTAFLSESSDLYRVTGTDFIFTLTDGRRMDTFRKSLGSSDSMNMKRQYGNLTVILELNFGIATSYKDGSTADELINNVKKALTVSLNVKYASNYAFYKDIVHD